LKKKLLFGFITLVMVLAVFLTACGPTAPTTPTTPTEPTKPTLPAKDAIVIGYACSLSGPLAQIHGSAGGPVQAAWEKYINEVEGGIYVKDYDQKLPVKFIIYDDKSDAGTCTRLIDKLCVEDKVDFLLGPTGTAMLFAAAPIANKNKTIMIGLEGGASTLIPMMSQIPYVFMSLSFSNWYQIPVLAQMFADKGIEKVYLISIADLFGVEYAGAVNLYMMDKGIQVIGDKSVPPDIKDLSPILKEAQASGADAFLSMCYPDQNILCTAQMMELGYNPKAVVTGPGANFGFWHDIFGPNVEGVLHFSMANRETSPAMKEMYDFCYEGLPETVNDWWGLPCYWAGLETLQRAIEGTGTLDSDKIKDFLQTNTFKTVFSDNTRYTNNMIDWHAHTGEIGQWINEKAEIVGPDDASTLGFDNYVKTADWVYPKPAWVGATPE
jgi:ABC-type branched-subunit amino acid transport system substrate-binding protein